MKKLYTLSLIVLIPLLGGILLSYIGASSGNDTVATIGRLISSVGVPVTMFIVIIVCIVMIITGKLDLGNKPSYSNETETASEETAENNSENNSDYTQNQIEREYGEIEEVNSSYGYSSEIKQSQYFSRHVAENYKNSSKKEKILGWLFFTFLITDFAMIPISAFVLKSWTATIICFCLFVGTIILAAIITSVLQRVSIHAGKNKYKYREVLCGEVKSCSVSSMSSAGGSHTTRITRVVYKVQLTAEGKDYTAYSRRYFLAGESVNFAVIGKRLASILEEETEQPEEKFH